MVLKKFLSNQFFLFVFVCSFAAVINFSSRIAIGFFLSYVTSIIIAYIIGIFAAYTLCRIFVFEAKQNDTSKQFFYFCIVNIFAIILTVTVSVTLADYGLLFIHHEFLRIEIAHFIGMCSPVFSSYLGHKYLSFR